MLQQHFPHVCFGYVGADSLTAQVKENSGCGLVRFTALFGRGHRLPQVLQYCRQVCLELDLGLPELLDIGQFVVQEAAYQPVQFPGPGHIHPQGHAAVLDQNGCLRVLEDYVVLGVAPVELTLDFGVQVVVGVLGFPVTSGHAQGVLHGAIGNDVAWCLQFGDEDQLFLVLAAVGVQAVLESTTDVQLVIGAAELHQFLELAVVSFYVGIGWHDWTIIGHI